ncbi:Delta endotoxin [Cordyceps fumosorosea ARSEF 2679]|uniref:Delta endotoxin n=1 Tax=Cordyceps fumosorosea (strain ARSEF 2679) TaxID=1081104 RepID=A0A167Q4U0_CORFA|nr:Delta endotoxin [Cordyceps fumosorosea ARSEF 2679]OAA57291.1 Delta endotoxin [Cordyceps fumosorosea ARSEF 2679]
MAFDHDLAAKLAEKTFTAVQAGAKATLDNPNEIAQTVLGVMAVSLNAIPVAGSAIAAFAVAMSLIAFPAPKKDPWDQVRQRVEALVGQKLQAAELERLKRSIDGFRTNAETYALVWKAWNDKPADNRAKEAENLRVHHTNSITLLQAGIPAFQSEGHAAAALPLFAAAANQYIALLADGIKQGKEMGWDESHYGKTLVSLFNKATGQDGANAARGLLDSRDEDADAALLDMAKEALEAAKNLGVDPALMALWQEAYTSLVHKFAIRGDSTLGRRDGVTRDLVAHVKRWYVDGRKQVQPRTWVDGKVDGQTMPHYGDGYKQGLALATYADWDLEMVENALNYAELWPYLAGTKGEVSAEAMRNLDREIFRGPYVRYTGNTKFSAQAGPKVEPRSAPITGVKMCAGDNIRMMQVKYGNRWEGEYGKCGPARDKEEAGFELKEGEYITNVDIITGHKLGQLKFITNMGEYGPYGRRTHADLPMSVNRTGYALTSMHGTNYAQHDPEGIEGIILGFRPLLTAKKD